MPHRRRKDPFKFARPRSDGQPDDLAGSTISNANLPIIPRQRGRVVQPAPAPPSIGDIVQFLGRQAASSGAIPGAGAPGGAGGFTPGVGPLAPQQAQNVPQVPTTAAQGGFGGFVSRLFGGGQDGIQQPNRANRQIDPSQLQFMLGSLGAALDPEGFGGQLGRAAVAGVPLTQAREARQREESLLAGTTEAQEGLAASSADAIARIGAGESHLTVAGDVLKDQSLDPVGRATLAGDLMKIGSKELDRMEREDIAEEAGERADTRLSIAQSVEKRAQERFDTEKRIAAEGKVSFKDFPLSDGSIRRISTNSVTGETVQTVFEFPKTEGETQAENAKIFERDLKITNLLNASDMTTEGKSLFASTFAGTPESKERITSGVLAFEEPSTGSAEEFRRNFTFIGEISGADPEELFDEATLGPATSALDALGMLKGNSDPSSVAAAANKLKELTDLIQAPKEFEIERRLLPDIKVGALDALKRGEEVPNVSIRKLALKERKEALPLKIKEIDDFLKSPDGRASGLSRQQMIKDLKEAIGVK